MKGSLKPTILVIGPTPPPYQGVSVVTDLLINSNLASDFNLVHLDTSDRRSLANVASLDLRNIALALQHALRFGFLLLTRRPHLVYVPISEGTLGFLRDALFLVPARLTCAAVVVHLHGGAFESFYRNASRPMKWVIRCCLKKVKVAIVLGDVYRSILSGIVPSERIRVVPNGIPAEPYTQPVRSIKTHKDKYRILYMGSLFKSKGFLDFIQAAPLVLETVPKVEFLLMGDDSFSEAKSAQAWVREQGLGDTVRFLGVRQGAEKIRILSEADVLVFPSRGSEGHPLVLLEAMAAGLPIVTTCHATARETLNGGALYIRSQDPADLAEKLVALIEDPHLRGSMAASNRMRFERCFSLERFTENMKAALLGALAEPARCTNISGTTQWL